MSGAYELWILCDGNFDKSREAPRGPTWSLGIFELVPACGSNSAHQKAWCATKALHKNLGGRVLSCSAFCVGKDILKFTGSVESTRSGQSPHQRAPPPVSVRQLHIGNNVVSRSSFVPPLILHLWSTIPAWKSLSHSSIASFPSVCIPGAPNDAWLSNRMHVF